MDGLGGFVLAAIALEAVVHIVRNVWDEGARSDWGTTTLAYYVIALAALFVANDASNSIADVFDFDQDWLGTIITGLAAGRVAMWVNALYKKTAG